MWTRIYWRGRRRWQSARETGNLRATLDSWMMDERCARRLCGWLFGLPCFVAMFYLSDLDRFRVVCIVLFNKQLCKSKKVNCYEGKYLECAFCDCCQLHIWVPGRSRVMPTFFLGQEVNKKCLLGTWSCPANQIFFLIEDSMILTAVLVIRIWANVAAAWVGFCSHPVARIPIGR